MNWQQTGACTERKEGDLILGLLHQLYTLLCLQLLRNSAGAFKETFTYLIATTALSDLS